MKKRDYFRIKKIYVRVPLVLAAIALLASFVMIPQYVDYTDKSEAAALYVVAESIKDEVANLLLKNIPASTINTSEIVDDLNLKLVTYYLHITDSGEIITVGEQFNTFLMHRPHKQGNEIDWSCIIRPLFRKFGRLMSACQ